MKSTPAAPTPASTTATTATPRTAWQPSIRAALNATATPLNHDHVGGDGRMAYRQGALINLILMTDENSDQPFYSADRLAGQTSTNPPGTQGTFQASDWQTEVDNTAAAVVSAGAFLNMLVARLNCNTCNFQYGDADADVSDADLGNWDEDATLANLLADTSKSELSLQAQVIQGGLVARTFDISRLGSETGFVNNFFEAKIQETLLPICGDNEITGDEECDDGNTVGGDCCSDTCMFEAQGAACTDDADACTDDQCDATGTCQHDAITCPSDSDPCTDDSCDSALGCNYPAATDGTTCDDGLFCTTTDTCTGGVCGGTGNPCPGNECQATCNEGAGMAECADPVGTPCGSDADVCTDDICDGSGSCIHPNNSAPCDDGDECTVGDFCSGGSCQAGPSPNSCDDDDDCTIDSCETPGGCMHENVQFFAACFAAVLAGDGTKPGQARVRAGTQMVGHACGDTGDIGAATSTDGSWFVRDDSNLKACKVRDASTEVIGDVVTGGGGVVKVPLTKNSDIFATGVSAIPGGQTVAKPPSGVIDTTGTAPGLAQCLAAQLNVPAIDALLGALPADDSFEKLVVKKNTSHTFEAANPGGISVIDIDKFLIGDNATITIDGKGGPEASVILRVGKKMDSNSGVQWLFVNGAAPERTVFYVTGAKLEIGQANTGGGTLFCPGGKTTVRAGTVWSGAVIGGKKVDVRENVDLTLAHYQGLNF